MSKLTKFYLCLFFNVLLAHLKYILGSVFVYPSFAMYVCIYGWMDGWMHACMYVCMYVYLKFFSFWIPSWLLHNCCVFI